VTETREERREAAATRRRWVTLAEVVAVLGVLIAALTWWQGWSDRRADKAEKAASAAAEAKARGRVDLTATVRDDGRELLLTDEEHEISEATVTWPSPLAAAVQRPPADPVVAVAPVRDALLKVTDGGPDDRTGRVPTLITVTYLDGDVRRTASGIYDVVWRTHGRALRGRALTFEGLRLRERGGTRARVDALWAHEKPR
jgi:type II secretory pathway pseudopilin PulG